MQLLITIPEDPKNPVPDCIARDRIYKSKINGRTRAVIYQFLADEYGEFCAYCGKPVNETGELDIEHVDGNSFRHYWRNLVLGCHRCNCAKNPKGWRKKMSTVCVRVCENEMPTPTSAELHLKAKYLHAFLTWLEDEFETKTMISYKRIYGVGVLRSGFPSEITINRYLKPLLSEEGPLYHWTDARTKIEYVRLRFDLKFLKAVKKKYCS